MKSDRITEAEKKQGKISNSNLAAAKDAKNDEFYTQLSDIQSELSHYTDKFKGKTVFCNCDDPFESNFVKYFLMNFNRFGLKTFLATGYKTSAIGGSEIGTANAPYALRVTSTSKYLIGTQKDLDVKGAKYLLETEGDRIMTPLFGNAAVDENGKPIQVSVKEKYIDEATGKEKTRTVKQDLYYEAGDFRSDMSIALLKESDVVVTNPPFSLFREFIRQLVEYDKQFLVIGNMNAITYKEIFPLIKNNKMWAGCSFNKVADFNVPDSYTSDIVDKKGRKIVKVPAITWFTNIDHIKRHQVIPLDLGYIYNGHENMYPKYDNYDAINVDKIAQIPCDYTECMGVPITFLDKYCPEQFEIIGLLQSSTEEQAGIPILRTYNDFKEMRQDMSYTGASGGKANGNPVLVGKSSKGNFLYNPLTREYVHSAYARILIKRKETN